MTNPLSSATSVNTETTRLVVAPDLVIRFVAGKAMLHTGGGQRPYSDDVSILELLARFVKPSSEDEILQLFEQPMRNSQANRIRELKNIAALVPATNITGSRTVPPADALLAPLADAVQRIAGSLAAFGPKASELLSDSTGISPNERLLAIVAGVTALETELNALRPGYVAEQLRKLSQSDGSAPIKLHLGCGDSGLPGWINIDAYPAELALDLRWGLPFADGSASHVFMSHVFEHLYHPEESGFVAGEIFRVLQPGGRLRLIVPDVEPCIQAYVAKDREFFENRKHTWSWWNPADTRLENFLGYAGAGPRASAFLESHKFGYDFETLAKLLTGAGFRNVIRSSYMSSDDSSLRVDSASKVAGAKSGDQYYSLFIEAIR